jgi:hypothetical protein
MERHVYLEVLLMEVEQMDENSFQPPIETLKDDKVVGEASPYTRKVWATAQYYARHVEELAVESRYSQPEEAKRMAPQIFEACQKRDLLAALGWLLARADAEYWKGNIGVRRGWQLTRPNAKSHQGFYDKIKGMFGEDDDE